jgi:hypothetical protein
MVFLRAVAPELGWLVGLGAFHAPLVLGHCLEDDCLVPWYLG